ncbi:unnamed protein product [Lupinus luteus]|uniref:Maturase K n=1 Tax=Lupinus luteus TaxID=3873 RepID=A0AAV1W0Z4_LUPLU
MEQPEGFIVPDEEHLVYRLKKSLYGLKFTYLFWQKIYHWLHFNVTLHQDRRGNFSMHMSLLTNKKYSKFWSNFLLSTI